MASFWTRALDKVTPWRRQGEVQRDQQAKKKKREDEQYSPTTPGGLSVTTAQPTQRVVVDQPKPPQTQRPEDLFSDLNNALKIGQRPSNPILGNTNAPVETPKPGTVVEPTLKVTNTPQRQRLLMPDGRDVASVPDTPEIILNRELDRGRSFEDIARDNSFDVNKVREYATATRPNYGIKQMEKPKQSIGNRFRDIFDTNTESDKYRRQQGNLKREAGTDEKAVIQEKTGNVISRAPIVGHIAKMANTGYRQLGEIDEVIETSMLQRVQGDIMKKMQAAQKSGDMRTYYALKDQYNLVTDRVNESMKSSEELHTKFKDNDGGLFNAGTLYNEEQSRQGKASDALKEIALPTAVTMLDLYTLGQGNIISEGVKQAAPRIGFKAAVRQVAPNIVKAGVGNFASGSMGTAAEGGDLKSSLISGGINSALGTVPDILLPMAGQSFRSRVLGKIFSGGKVSAEDLVSELDEAGISASAEAANNALRPRPISIAQDIPVESVEGLQDLIRVRNMNEPGRLIQEVTGDATTATPNPLIQATADEARDDAIREAAFQQSRQPTRPDPRIEGITPRTNETFNLTPEAVKGAQDKLIDDYADMLRSLGEGNGVDMVPDGQGGYIRTSNNYRPGMGSGRVTKAQWREEAERQLRAGKADGEVQKAFNDAADPEVQALLSKGEQAPVTEGSPIAVKQVTGIPVTDQSKMPIDLPENPGTVREITATAPTEAKTAAAASAPVVTRPAALPTEVQEVLDNPKKFTKREVAAARNQAKLARQKAKADEAIAESMGRIEAAKPGAPQPEGYASTGQFARGRKGNVYEKASNVTEQAAGEAEMAMKSVDDLLQEVGGKESFTAGDRRRITAALENATKSNPDDLDTRVLLKKLQSKSRTELGQGLALIPKVIRKSASADTLVGRWEGKIVRVLEDTGKLTENDYKLVQGANDKFTLARDRAFQLEETFKRTGSEADFKAWEDAHKAAYQADVDAKFTEANVANRVLKGEKGAGVTKVLDEMKKEADVNTMDSVTASMLSGTATGFRNTFGTELAGIENRLFANTRAKITNKLFGENVGGFDRTGAKIGRKVGVVKLGKDFMRRAEIGGKNPIEWAKNWSTTINSGGESSLQSQVYSRLAKYYKNQFADSGLSGKELDMRMRHALLTDPDGMGSTFMDASMKSSGLTGLFQKGQAIEKGVTDFIGQHTDNRAAQAASKLFMRLAVGFPTATGNFLVQSGKRLTVGLPSFLEAGVKAAKGDKMAAALAFERGLKEAGSGAATFGLGVMLGANGMISGPYPEDPEERAQWERDGISENSIKIGGHWFPIPQGAGMLGLPLLTGAAVGREGDSDESLKEMFSPKNLAELLPTDQLQGFLNMASGNGAPQDLKNTLASGVRAGTPAGSLLNQISKSFDNTKNDTSTKDFWHNVLDQIYSGVPGVNNMANIPDKVDDAGNVIENPDPLALAFGASSKAQGAGEARTAQIQGQIDSALEGLQQLGVTNDPVLKEVLDEDERKIYDKVASGKKVDEKDVKKLKEAFVKGVSSEGTDTAYLERGEYDTNLSVLKLKKELMESDKTTKPSSLKDVDTAIKRGEIYKANSIPYDLISKYQSIGVEDWRKMGDPEEDEYDPDMYQKLWEIDEMLKKGGVSYKTNAPDKNKYFVKEKKAGSGSGGRGGQSTDFGTLKASKFAPNVQNYETIDQRSGSVPIIRTVRPNIVHKISTSG